MFEPVLEKNRAEFNRLRRREYGAVGAAVVGIVAIMGAVVATRTIDWVLAVSYALSGLLGLSIVVLEVRRTLVFRRDLRERVKMDVDSGVN